MNVLMKKLDQINNGIQDGPSANSSPSDLISDEREQQNPEVSLI